MAKFEEVLVKFVDTASQILEALREIQDLREQAAKVLECLQYLKDFAAARAHMKVAISGETLYVLTASGKTAKIVDLTQFRERPVKEVLNAIYNDDVAAYFIASECFDGVVSLVHSIKKLRKESLKRRCQIHNQKTNSKTNHF
jgi:hypothetical protein